MSTHALLSVLLVDDDEEQHILVRDLLPAQAGYTVEWVPDVATAREALEVKQYDVALVDHRLPDASGLEVLADMRSAGVPAIMLTGDSSAETDRRALAAGATDYLVKAEVTGSMLRRAIRYASERRRAEQLLEDGQAALRRLASAHGHLAAIVQSTGDAIYSQSLDGTVVSWNSGAEHLYGYSAAEMLGRTLCVLESPSRRGQLQELLQRTRGGQVVKAVECDQVCKDGRCIRVALTMSPVHDESGEMTGVATIVRDVTEQRRVQEVLRESEARHRAMFDEAPVGVALLDRDGRWLRVNGRLLELLKYEAADLGDLRLADLSEPGAAAQDGAIAAELISGRRARATQERRLRRGDGVWIWVRLNVSVYRPPEGAPLFVSMVEDISQGKQAELELAQMFELSPDMLCTASIDGYFTRVNPAFPDVLGYSSGELLSRPLLELVHPDDQEATRRELARLRAGQTTVAFVNRYRLADGTYIWLDWHSKCDVANGVIYAVARDQTERRGLEEQLRQVQKIDAIGQLAGAVAHDFNNVLTAITGFAELALQSLPEGDPARSEVQEIARAGESAVAMTRQLLAFSRRQLLRPETLDLNDVVSHTSGLLRRLLGANVTLEVTAAPDLGAVEADRVQIEQVLLNLVVNARDAMPHGGTVSVDLRNAVVDDEECGPEPGMRPGRYVTVSVSDTGCGMTDDVRLRVFEPFFTTKERGKGTGLGLATVYGIVKQSGGWIRVYSELGQGSTFKVYLPLTERRTEQRSAALAPTGPVHGNETILVVEDQPDVRNVIRQVLQRHGYRVIEAGCAEQAMTAVVQHGDSLRLLLTDVVLPGASGPDIAGEVGQRCPALPVLYMSGHTENAMVRQGVLERGLAFVEKPFTAGSLVRSVRRAIDSSPAPASSRC